MSLLQQLFGGRDRAAPPAGGRPLQQVVNGRGAAPVLAPGAKVVQLLPKRTAPRAAIQPQTYKQVSDLPERATVVSGEGGQFELNKAQQTSMAVLKLADVENAYLVLATRGQFGGAAYQALCGRIKETDAKLSSVGYADEALIDRLMQDQTAASGSSKDDNNSIIRSINTLAQEALDADVSDIHIESRSSGAIVRMRINGRLQVHSDSWTKEYVDRFARALQGLADDDSKAQSFMSDCQMSVSLTLPSRSRVKLRVQCSPAYPDDGMDVIIRLLKVAANAKVKSLETLGYHPDHVTMLRYMQSSPHGLIVIAGTTGSGKSTTLQTLMVNIHNADPGKKLISIEDPPEYVLPITQIPVARRKDDGGKSPFVSAMRNTIRMDPDVIMVGEIRDVESAALLSAMVQSGHMVLSTIHTESAIGIIGRLRGMKLDSDVMAGRGFISGLIFQTLVAVLCKHCRIDYSPDDNSISQELHDRIRQVVKPGDTLFLENSAGCPHCKKSGIAGRTVCAEMVVPDAAMRDMILQNDMKGAHAHWRKMRTPTSKLEDSMYGATALEHAILKMRRGEVSPAAVEDSLGMLHDFTEGVDVSGDVGELLGL